MIQMISQRFLLLPLLFLYNLNVMLLSCLVTGNFKHGMECRMSLLLVRILTTGMEFRV